MFAYDIYMITKLLYHKYRAKDFNDKKSKILKRVICIFLIFIYIIGQIIWINQRDAIPSVDQKTAYQLAVAMKNNNVNEFLDTHLNIAKRYNHPLSYAIIDLDNFKQINDTYGHLTGDYVLVSLANLLKTSLRSTDFIGRYGGEEFAIIATYTDAAAAFESLDRIRNEFAKLNHYSGDQVFNVTFSAGVACYPKYTNLDDLMAVADKALYHEK